MSRDFVSLEVDWRGPGLVGLKLHGDCLVGRLTGQARHGFVVDEGGLLADRVGLAGEPNNREVIVDQGDGVTDVNIEAFGQNLVEHHFVDVVDLSSRLQLRIEDPAWLVGQVHALDVVDGVEPCNGAVGQIAGALEVGEDLRVDA